MNIASLKLFKEVINGRNLIPNSRCPFLGLFSFFKIKTF